MLSVGHGLKLVQLCLPPNTHYKCPHHLRTEIGAEHFLFSWSQFAAARRAAWHARSKGLPQLKFLISLPPSAWFGRRGCSGIDSAASGSKSYAEKVARPAVDNATSRCFLIRHVGTEANFRSRRLFVWTAVSGRLTGSRNSGVTVQL